MKSSARSAISCSLIAAMLILVTQSVPQSASTLDQRDKLKSVKDGDVRSGPDVAARVQKLKQENVSVRAAFKAFEKKGRRPKVEDSTVITGGFSSSSVMGNKVEVFQKASFELQDQPTVSGNGYELILIPSVESYDEWQGTAISTRYDDHGNIAEQYTANIVSVANSEANPTIVYEAAYESDGTAYLRHEPGMYTGYALGTLGQDHQALYGTPPPTDLQPWQNYEEPPPPKYCPNPLVECLDAPPVARKTTPHRAENIGQVSYKTVTFQARQDRHIERYQLRCGTISNPQPCGGGLRIHPYVVKYFVQVAAGCGTMVFCRADVRCRAVACGAAAISQLPTLFGY